MIPQQLKQKGINFVLLEKGGKKPFEIGWTKKQIEFDNPKLIEHINNKGNYGVRGGGDKKLLVVDFDDEETQKEILKKLPDTFKIKTGSGLLHLYYFSDGSDSFKIFDEEMNTLADIQGEGKQVVGAGSIHPNGNPYEVIADRDISFIHYSELKAFLMPYDKKPKKEIEKKEYPKIDLDENFIDIAKSNVCVHDILNLIGINISLNPTECPFHSSKGGKCLGFERDVAHCFHCDDSWNIFSLVTQYKNCDFKTALEFIADNFGLREKYDECKQKYVEKIKEKPFDIFTKKNQAKKFNNIQPLFFDKTGMFWLWNIEETKWEIVDEIDILNMISDTTGEDTISSKSRTEILNSLKQEGRKRIPKPIKKTWIQFKDKIYDIGNGESFAATPEYFVTNPIPWSVSESPETPVMDKIFKEWVGEHYVPLLHEILAYSLIPDYPINRLFCFIGSGMNGKSKFLDLLQKFVGMDNVCSTELDTLLTSRFEVTRLHKKLVCLMGETNFNEMSKTSILKKLTGGDIIGFEYKNKNPFEDHNYAKIIIATNNLPTTTDKTIGFYRRWCIIDFPNSFNEKKNILEDIPEEEYSNLAYNSIVTLNKLLNKREFTNEGTIEERKEKYESKSNFLIKFVKEFTEENFNEWITVNDFNKKFQSWCKENKHREMSEASIGLQMKKLEYQQERKYFQWMYDGKGGQARVWIGIKWKD